MLRVITATWVLETSDFDGDNAKAELMANNIANEVIDGVRKTTKGFISFDAEQCNRMGEHSDGEHDLYEGQRICTCGADAWNAKIDEVLK